MSPQVCGICGAECRLIDAVDFNRSCEEVRGRYLPVLGKLVDYYLCDDCHFCFAPELASWTLEDFERNIYNHEYAQVDPDYSDARPRANAGTVLGLFDEVSLQIRHLDYGGGNGLLSSLLFERGWDSISYDPFVNRDVEPHELGTFDLITAFEVFEHVPDVNRLAAELGLLLRADGFILFSTLLSDENITRGQRLTWWYAAPRNGHISLFSRRSLETLARKNGFAFGSESNDLHAFWRGSPRWAAPLIPKGE